MWLKLDLNLHSFCPCLLRSWITGLCSGQLTSLSSKLCWPDLFSQLIQITHFGHKYHQKSDIMPPLALLTGGTWDKLSFGDINQWYAMATESLHSDVTSFPLTLPRAHGRRQMFYVHPGLAGSFQLHRWIISVELFTRSLTSPVLFLRKTSLFLPFINAFLT